MAWYKCIGGNGSGSSTIRKGISAPSSSMGSNGQVYLQYAEGIAPDLMTFGSLIENRNVMNLSVGERKAQFTYVAGQNIGAQIYKQIDLTNITQIRVTVKSSAPSYNNYATPAFAPILIIENTINPASNYPANTSIVSANGETYRVNTQGDTETFGADVSELTGNYWVIFSSTGATSEWNNFVLVDTSGVETIVSSFAKVSGTWQDLIGTNVNDIGGTEESAFETASIFRWFYSQGSTCWGVMKMADGNVIGQNGDDSNSSITLDGSTMTVVFHGTSQSIEVTAKTAITLKAYATARTLGTVTPTEYSMSANDTQTFTPDNLYGGLYLEAIK